MKLTSTVLIAIVSVAAYSITVKSINTPPFLIFMPPYSGL